MYDVIIIGAGSAGLSARSVVAKHTDNYLVFDSGPLGTTCARTGCMPAKALLEMSQRESDSSKVFKQVRELRDYFIESVKKSFAEWKEHFVNEKVEFKDPHTVIAGGIEYKAKNFIIAVGSRPRIPKKWKEFEDFLITTDSLFDLEKLPDSLAIVGLGPVGLETAQALSRFPIRVKGYNNEKLLEHFNDLDLQKYAQDYFSTQFELQADQDISLLVKDNKIIIKTNEKEEEFEKVILAVGRKSNVDKLNLGDDLAADTNKKTLSLNKHPHIYIAGDANDRLPILHEANFEGQFAAKKIFENMGEISRKVKMNIIFTTPQICLVGEAVGKYMGEASFEDQGRSRLKGLNVGKVKVYFDESMKIKGAKLFCADAEYLAHFLAMAIDQEITREDLLALPYYHPSIMEGLETAIKNAK